MIQLQTLSDGQQSDYSQHVQLDGVVYQLRLTWHSRADAWYMSLYLLDGSPIVTGRAVRTGTDLLSGCVAEGRPMGLLIAAPITGALVDPGLRGLGTTSVLTYYSVGEESPFG